MSRAGDGGGDDQILLRPQAAKMPTDTIEGWKKECATTGTPRACYNVAVDYAQTQGDEPKAVEYLRPLCKKDYVLGRFNLGGILIKELATRKEGLAAFQKACALSKAKTGTPKENEVTTSACPIAEVVAKNIDAAYMDIAAKLSITAKPTNAPPNHDLTGRYKVAGGAVSILQGTDELWLVYESVWGGDHTCSCVAQARRQEDGSWETSGDLVGKIDETSSEIAISSPQEPECCGANWAGIGRVRNRPAPLKRCAVTAPKLAFHAADESLTRAYLVAGDRVDAIERHEADSEFVVARFVGKKKTTIGLLEKSGLACTGK